MEETRRTEVVVGLVSIIGAVVLILGIMLGKGCSFNTGAQVLRVQLENSGGLEQGSPVVINGVKRGRVTLVEPSGTSVVAVIEVDRTDDIHADAHALVSMLEITGGKKLEILPGTSATKFDASQLMPGRAAIDVGGLVTLVGDISGELVTLLRRLDTVSAAVNSLLADGTVITNVKSMSADGAILMHDVREWLQTHRDDLSISIKEVKGALADVRRVVNSSEPKLNSTLTKLDNRLNELEGLITNGNQAISNADSLIQNINGIVVDVKTNRSLVNAVLYDTTFRKKIDTLSNRFNRLVDEIKRNGVNVNVGLGHR